MQIKRADRGDIGRLAENRLEFVRSIRKIADPRDFLDRTRTYLQKHMEDGSLISYLALDQERIVSSCILCLYETLPTASCLSGKSGLLLNVYTIPAIRGRDWRKAAAGADTGRQAGRRRQDPAQRDHRRLIPSIKSWDLSIWSWKWNGNWNSGVAKKRESYGLRDLRCYNDVC
jgi:hypothetical protein